jgi:hypothetical protein
MTRKTLAAFAVSALVLAACGSGTTTDDSIVAPTDDTSLGGTATTAGTATGTDDSLTAADVASEVAELEAELAVFATEIEASAPEPVVSAFEEVQTEVSGLVSAASDLELTTDELAPVEDAALALTEAVADSDVDLSAEFMDFWSEFSTRIQALAA